MQAASSTGWQCNARPWMPLLYCSLYSLVTSTPDCDGMAPSAIHPSSAVLWPASNDLITSSQRSKVWRKSEMRYVLPPGGYKRRSTPSEVRWRWLRLAGCVCAHGFAMANIHCAQDTFYQWPASCSNRIIVIVSGSPLGPLMASRNALSGRRQVLLCCCCCLNTAAVGRWPCCYELCANDLYMCLDAIVFFVSDGMIHTCCCHSLLADTLVRYAKALHSGGSCLKIEAMLSANMKLFEMLHKIVRLHVQQIDNDGGIMRNMAPWRIPYAVRTCTCVAMHCPFLLCALAACLH